MSAESTQPSLMTFNLSSSDINSLPSTTGHLSMRLLCSARQRFGLPLQKLFCAKPTPVTQDQGFGLGTVPDLASRLDTFIVEEMPQSVQWRPNLTDPQDLVLSARLNCTLLSMQIFLHRLLISEVPSEIHVCLKAASKLIEILEVIRSRGLLESTASWTPYLVTQPALTLLLVACGKHDFMLPSDRANAWAGVHQCINILNALSPTTFIAQRLCESLTILVQTCIEEELFPTLKDNTNKNNKKRAMTESYEAKVASESQAANLTSSPSETVPELYISNLMNSTDAVYSRDPSSTSDALTSATVPWAAPFTAESPETTRLNCQNAHQATYLSSEELFSLPPSQLDATLFEYPGKTLVPGLSTSLGPPEWLGYETPLLTTEPECYNDFDKLRNGIPLGEQPGFDALEFFKSIHSS